MPTTPAPSAAATLRSLCLCAGTVLTAAPAFAGADLPTGFALVTMAEGFERPVAVRFAPDGRAFVAEQRGMVWVVDPIEGRLPTPFIDLRDEVNFTTDRGLIGLALDPDFADNRRVYLSFTVDKVFGPPEEGGTSGTGGRLVRYSGSAESAGNLADPKSRVVLMGDPLSDGPPCCWPSHSVGTINFGADGSLLLAAGDGAVYVGADIGGSTPWCFTKDLFGPEEDIGAFRAQSHESLAGKILRLDPETGAGLEDNPFFDGNPFSKRSRIWITGLRNPFRFAVRPGTPAPGTLYVGDVGGGAREEISVLRGGDNAGWPCFEGNIVSFFYANVVPPAWGCDTIGTPLNPGPLTGPVMAWSHNNPASSSPPGTTCKAIVGGVFYPGGRYPPAYHGRLFHADHVTGWIRAASFDAADALVDTMPFLDGEERPVEISVDPITGDLVYVVLEGALYRIAYAGSDLDGNGRVDGADLGLLLGAWGTRGGGADLDGSGFVDGADLGILLSGWTG